MIPDDVLLSFDDVLIVPGYSEMESRSYASTNIAIIKTGCGWLFAHPIISANMETVTESDMATAMYFSGGLGIIHRYNTIDEQRKIVNITKGVIKSNYVAATVGVKDLTERLDMLIYNGVQIICLDVAYAYSKLVKDAVKFINSTRDMNNTLLIVGNVATYDGAKFLVDLDVDMIKVGVGSGGTCTTRIVTGVGIPQISAIMDCVHAIEGTNVKIIADGGIKNSGDIAKALAAGAHMVMVGGLLAGCKESPGYIYENVLGDKYKVYRGMASKDAVVQCLEKEANHVVPEGVSMMTKYSGSVNDVIYNLVGGLRSAMSYVGAESLSQFRDKTDFIRITSNGYHEGEPHNALRSSYQR